MNEIEIEIEIEKINALLCWQKDRGLSLPSIRGKSLAADIDEGELLIDNTENIAGDSEKTGADCEAALPPIFDSAASNAELLIVSSKNSWNDFDLAAPESREAKDLLDKMISAMKLDHVSISVAQIIENIQRDSSQLEEELQNLKAKVIVLLDKKAIQILSVKESNHSFSEIRGMWLESSAHLQNLKFIATWHPNKLMSHPTLKKDAWHDLKMVMSYFGS